MKLIPFSRYKVVGHSMMPTLNPGQEILSFNWAYLFSKPKVGDIVVFEKDGKEFIKRVQKYVDRGIFVSGDNKEDSLDSRKLGPVKVLDIVGKVILVN